MPRFIRGIFYGGVNCAWSGVFKLPPTSAPCDGWRGYRHETAMRTRAIVAHPALPLFVQPSMTTAALLPATAGARATVQEDHMPASEKHAIPARITLIRLNS